MTPKYELTYSQPTSTNAILGGFEIDGCYTIHKNGKPTLFFETFEQAQQVFRDLNR